MNHFKKRGCFVQAESFWVSSIRRLSVRLCSARLAVQCQRGLTEAELCSTRDGEEKSLQNVTQKAISKEIIGDENYSGSFRNTIWDCGLLSSGSGLG